MKRLRRLLTVGLLVALGSTVAQAQVVVVSAKSADGLISGVRSIVSATDLGDPIQPILGFLDNLKAPEMLKGLDRAKPLGAYMDLPANPGEMPYATILIPVTNQADFLALLEQYNAQVKPVADIPGVTHSIELPGGPPTPLLGRFEDGYACFSNRPAGPPSTAALKPAKVLAGRPAMLAATVRFDLVPAPMKKMFLDGLEANIAPQREQKPNEDLPTFQGRLAGMALVQNSITTLLRDGGPLTLEIAESKGDLTIDLTAKALPGSKLAASLKSFGSTPSLFRGLGVGSAANVQIRAALSDEMKKALGGVTTTMRENVAKNNADTLTKDIGNDTADLVESILTAPAIDVAATLLGPTPVAGKASVFTGVGGLKVQDGPRVDKFLRKLATAASKNMPANVEKITLDKDKASDGVSPIHEIRLKSGNPAMARFGEPVIRIATRKDAVVFAIGSQSLPAIKQALDAIAKPPTGPSPQVKIETAVSKAAFITAENPKAAEELATMLRSQGIFQGANANRDRVGLTINVAEDLAVRLRVDAPTLKFFAMFGMRQ